MVDCIGTRLVRSRDGSHGDIDCVYMRLIIGFEVEYDQYSDSAKSCKRVHIPNIAIIGFGNIPNELAGICQPNRNMMWKNGTGHRIIP